MFTIQFQSVSGEHKMQTFDSADRQQLVKHLAHFNMPITAVYEQASVITKAMRTELGRMPGSQLSRHAKDFVSSHI